MSEAAIVWFRQDLRLANNPALSAALDNHQRIIAVFIHAGADRTDQGHACVLDQGVEVKSFKSNDIMSWNKNTLFTFASSAPLPENKMFNLCHRLVPPGAA